MTKSFVERQIEDAVQGMFDDKAVRFMKGVSEMAAKQGGASTAENYRLLGKRALIALGGAVVAVQVTTSLVGLLASRKSEEKRVERIVRRILAEESQQTTTGV